MFPKTEGPRTWSSLRRFCGPSSALSMPTRETGGAVVSPGPQRHGAATLGHRRHTLLPQHTCRGNQRPERGPCDGTASLAASSPRPTGLSSQHGAGGVGWPMHPEGHSQLGLAPTHHSHSATFTAYTKADSTSFLGEKCRHPASSVLPAYGTPLGAPAPACGVWAQAAHSRAVTPHLRVTRTRRRDQSLEVRYERNATLPRNA